MVATLRVALVVGLVAVVVAGELALDLVPVAGGVPAYAAFDALMPSPCGVAGRGGYVEGPAVVAGWATGGVVVGDTFGSQYAGSVVVRSGVVLGCDGLAGWGRLVVGGQCQACGFDLAGELAGAGFGVLPPLRDRCFRDVDDASDLLHEAQALGRNGAQDASAWSGRGPLEAMRERQGQLQGQCFRVLPVVGCNHGVCLSLIPSAVGSSLPSLARGGGEWFCERAEKAGSPRPCEKKTPPLRPSRVSGCNGGVFAGLGAYGLFPPLGARKAQGVTERSGKPLGATGAACAVRRVRQARCVGVRAVSGVLARFVRPARGLGLAGPRAARPRFIPRTHWYTGAKLARG